jgi:hypothetical protein
MEVLGDQDPEVGEAHLEQLLCYVLDSNVRLGNQPDASVLSRSGRVDISGYDRCL